MGLASPNHINEINYVNRNYGYKQSFYKNNLSLDKFKISVNFRPYPDPPPSPKTNDRTVRFSLSTTLELREPRLILGLTRSTVLEDQMLFHGSKLQSPSKCKPWKYLYRLGKTAKLLWLQQTPAPPAHDDGGDCNILNANMSAHTKTVSQNLL